MFKKWVRTIVRDEILRFSWLLQVIRLDKDAKYILAVDDDEAAKNLVEAIDSSLDIRNGGPKIVVLAAKGIKLIEVSGGK